MPKLKPGTIIPTDEEGAVITAAAMSDPDAIPFTDEEWEAVIASVVVNSEELPVPPPHDSNDLNQKTCSTS